MGTKIDFEYVKNCNTFWNSIETIMWLILFIWKQTLTFTSADRKAAFITHRDQSYDSYFLHFTMNYNKPHY